MIDILFTTVPFTDTTMPMMAPAMLKSIAVKAGKTSIAIDLNSKYTHKILNHLQKDKLLLFFKNGFLDESAVDVVENMLDQIVDDIMYHQPRKVALSVFTYDCKIAAKYISWKIRRAFPAIKIILGGAGLFEHLTGETSLGDELVKHNIIDFYVRGDGENPLYEFLANNSYHSGVNSSNWQQLSNTELNQLPAPDYADYDFSQYEKNAMIPILGSRGCVRQCTFCDIHAHWKNFTFRDAENIFDEIIELKQRYGYTNFKFQDSLINGNMKQYRKLTKLLTEYNIGLNDPMQRISWSSFFIFKPKNHFTEEDWYYTSYSGAHNLAIGIETLSNESRFHLGKKFTNDDIEFGLDMMMKYNKINPYGNMKAALLFLIGYITETEQDIQNAIKWWEEHTAYRDMLIVNLGTPLGILKNTPLERDFDKLELKWVGPNDTDWANKNSDPKNSCSMVQTFKPSTKEK